MERGEHLQDGGKEERTAGLDQTRKHTNTQARRHAGTQARKDAKTQSHKEANTQTTKRRNKLVRFQSVTLATREGLGTMGEQGPGRR